MVSVTQLVCFKTFFVLKLIKNSYLLALDSDGFVYSFGNGTYGQLGVEAVIKQRVPQKINILSEPIRRISTKYFHSLAVSRDNRNLYVWGTNPQSIRLQANILRKSRLSHPNESIERVVPNQEFLKPTKVDISHIGSEIIKICSGSLHSLLLTAEGDIYSFGRGTEGQLGHEKSTNIKIPTKIEFFREIKVTDIATGSNFSLAADISGNIWGFGNNSDGQIGPKNCSLNQNNSKHEKNKKISIQTNRRFITIASKCVEYIPIVIPFVDEMETYCDSLNYSIDINAMKTSTRFSLIEDNINALSNEKSICFDRKLLALLLAFYRQELDLYSILNRFKSFKCHQMTAFVYEIQNDFSNAFDSQLEALQTSEKFIDYYKNLFLIFLKKSLKSIEKSTKTFDIFVKFWIRNEFELNCLEKFLEKCFKNDIKDSMFGISFFNYLKSSQNVSNRFSPRFLLSMVDFTIENINEKPEKLFSYQRDIERITSDIEEVSFPSEKLWQNILTHFRCNKTSNSDICVEFDAIDEEILVFNCSHSYGCQEFRETVVPNFEKDIKDLEFIETKQIESILKIYENIEKNVSDCVCPECFVSHIKSKNVISI